MKTRLDVLQDTFSAAFGKPCQIPKALITPALLKEITDREYEEEMKSLVPEYPAIVQWALAGARNIMAQYHASKNQDR